MKTGRSLQELAAEIERQSENKRDFLADTRNTTIEIIDGTPFVNLLGEHRSEQFGINEIAHDQIGNHAGIPAKYYDRMRTEQPELLAQNINTWFGAKPTTRMLRTLDGRARAFLSDRYRPIDNVEVSETVFPIIASMKGAKIASCEITDRRLYIKVVDPRVTAEIEKGDVVQAGVIISNSEVGLGSVIVHPLIYRLVCSNGMIAQDSGIRKYHVGRSNESNGEHYEIYRNETIQADNQAFLMKIEDTVRAAVNEAQFAKLVGRLRETKDAKVDAIAVPRVVELTSKEFGLTQEEGKGVLGHLIDGGDLSLYGVANAVTRHAHDVESYDRSTELEATGYKIAMMEPRLWNRIKRDAV